MCENRFFICERCGNIVGMVNNSGVPIVCCGEKMKKLEPNTVEASHEKHLPVVTVTEDEIRVAVGSAAHPMTEEHSIQWLYLQTERGGRRKCLLPGEPPEAVFALDCEKVYAVYAYCNLHGLWKTDL